MTRLRTLSSEIFTLRMSETKTEVSSSITSYLYLLHCMSGLFKTLTSLRRYSVTSQMASEHQFVLCEDINWKLWIFELCDWFGQSKLGLWATIENIAQCIASFSFYYLYYLLSVLVLVKLIIIRIQVNNANLFGQLQLKIDCTVFLRQMQIIFTLYHWSWICAISWAIFGVDIYFSSLISMIIETKQWSFVNACTPNDLMCLWVSQHMQVSPHPNTRTKSHKY